MKKGSEKLKKKKLLRIIKKKIDKEEVKAWEAELRLNFVQAKEHNARAAGMWKIVKLIKKMK